MADVAPGARHAAHVEMSGSGRTVEGRGTGAAAAAVAGGAALGAALDAMEVLAAVWLWLVAAAPALDPMGAAGWDASGSAAFVRRALPVAVPPAAAAPVNSAAGPSGDELPVVVPLSGLVASPGGGGGAFDEEASVPAAPVPVPAAASMTPINKEEDIYIYISARWECNVSRGGGLTAAIDCALSDRYGPTAPTLPSYLRESRRIVMSSWRRGVAHFSPRGRDESHRQPATFICTTNGENRHSQDVLSSLSVAHPPPPPDALARLHCD